MTVSHGVIDLDMPSAEAGGPDEGGFARSRPGWKGATYLIVALVVGMALGGVGGARMWILREEQVRADTVALVALPGSSSSGMGLDDVGTLRFDAQLVLVNAGPAAITVEVEGARRPGVLVRGTGQSRLVRPGGTGWIDVEVTLECATAFTSEPLSVSFSVQTANHRVRRASYPIAVQGGPWQPACEPLRRIVSGPITATR